MLMSQNYYPFSSAMTTTMMVATTTKTETRIAQPQPCGKHQTKIRSLLVHEPCYRNGCGSPTATSWVEATWVQEMVEEKQQASEGLEPKSSQIS